MQIQPSQLATILSEWLIAITVLAVTFVVATSARAILKRLHKDHGWKILRQLAPSISNILYIVGFKIFADVAPLSEKLGIWLDNCVFIFAVIIFLRLAEKAVRITIEWSILKTNHSETLRQGFIPLIRNITTLFVFFTGGIMVLRHFNYDVMSLITALGVSSLAVGLAAKDTLSHMISGFILIIDRNLKPGDRINLNGIVGDIEEIGLRSTQILITDGNTLIVPNSELVNTKIINLSLPNRETTCTLSIRIALEVSFPMVKNIVFSVLGETQGIAKNRSTWVNLMSLSEGHQIIHIGFWITDLRNSGSITSEFHEKLISKLQNHDIKLLPPPPLPMPSRII